MSDDKELQLSKLATPEIIRFLEEYRRRSWCLDIKSASYQDGWCDCLDDMIRAAKAAGASSAPAQVKVMPLANPPICEAHKIAGCEECYW